MKSAVKFFWALFLGFMVSGCGGGGSALSDSTGGSTTPPTGTTSVTLSISSSNIAADTPATLTATVKNSLTGAIAGELVTFTLNDSALGTFVPAIGTALTDANGVATVTLASADVAGAGTVTASIASGATATVGFTMAGDGAGGGETTTIALAISNANISAATPATLSATVTNSATGVVAGQLVTFKLSDSTLGSFTPATGTALTDANGVATVTLATADIAGAGIVTASVASGASASVGFTMAGDGAGGGETTTIALAISNANISAATPATLSATVTNSATGVVAGQLVTFKLSNSSLGVFVPAIGTALTDTNGVATVTLATSDVAGAGTVTASIASGESATVGFTMAGDGGASGGSAQVTLALTDEAGNPIDTINSTTPGVLTAKVTGISQTVIVTFSVSKGDLPISTAITNSEGVASVRLYAGSELGAGTATASLVTGESVQKIFAIGATNVVMGSGTPFVSGQALVSASTLSAGGTATISVELKDGNGNPFTEPVDVNFASTCSNKSVPEAEISSPITAINGQASSTYLAQGCVGPDAITVTADVGGQSLSATGTITVLSADAGSIVFIDASPEQISIKGTGGDESSTLRFKVLDTNGNPVANKDVDFSLNTTVGGLTLDPYLATTNSQGIAQTVVNAGTVATSVRVTASVNGSSPLISSQSNVLVVTTGKPDQDSFSLSASTYNVEGWNYDGVQVTVTARLADAFNNPVPNGTAVVFTAEGGSIEGSCQTTDGVCSVLWTSQLPRPVGVDNNGPLLDASGNQIADPQSAEVELTNFKGDKYLGNYYGQPFGGRVTITATAIGEESFPDLNSNNIMDTDTEFSRFVGDGTDCGRDNSGDCYDLPEAFVDHNEDGIYTPAYDKGGSTDTSGDHETYTDFVDANNPTGLNEYNFADGEYNGVLCDDSAASTVLCSASKSVNVRRSLVLIMSGSEAYATQESNILIDDDDGLVADGVVNITEGGSARVYFTISDVNNQQMPAGTEVDISANGATITSSSKYVWPNSNYNGGRSFSVSLKGGAAGAGNLLVTVTTPGPSGNGSDTVTEVVNLPIVVVQAP